MKEEKKHEKQKNLVNKNDRLLQENEQFKELLHQRELEIMRLKAKLYELISQHGLIK